MKITQISPGVRKFISPVPLYEKLGGLNVYLLGEERLTVVDSGLFSLRARLALQAALGKSGRRLADIERIILTHGHPEHVGLAHWIRKKSGAPIFIHPTERLDLTPGFHKRFVLLKDDYRDFLTRHGAPKALVLELLVMGRAMALLQPPVRCEWEPLLEGMQFKTGNDTWEAIHAPGHSPGLVCLYNREKRLLISGDHLLPTITPNPVFDVRRTSLESDGTPFRSLVNYMKSVEKVLALPIETVLPGHGEPFANPGVVLDEQMVFYRKRQDDIAAVLKSGPLNVYQTSLKLFARLAPWNRFMAISDVLGNLEVMEEEGRVIRETRGGVVYFRPA